MDVTSILTREIRYTDVVHMLRLSLSLSLSLIMVKGEEDDRLCLHTQLPQVGRRGQSSNHRSDPAPKVTGLQGENFHRDCRLNIQWRKG